MWNRVYCVPAFGRQTIRCSGGPFHSAVPPDPVAAVRSLSQLVRPGGVIAFHEPSWTPILQLSAHLPLWSACASLARESLQRSGGNTEMGLALYRIFQQPGLPAPNLQMEIPLGDDPCSPRWIYELFALCCRKSANSIFLSRILTIWILSWKGSNPR
jgi:hypothetical protein